MKKNILAVTILLTLVLTPLMGLQTARADFLSCVAEGGNVAKCLADSQTSDTKTSFTEFQGGLAAPSTEGYAPSLTQATDVRTYALNITNYALGFLALIAVLIIIYGGFLYLTAAGKEEQAGKGKKAISYAVIGILIIMGSFAIVNTVLQAPGGKEGATQGAAPGQSTTSGSTQTRFNILATRVSTMAQDLVTAFQFHFEMQKDMAVIKDTDLACVTAAPKTCPTTDTFAKAINDAITKVDNIKNKLNDKTVDSIPIAGALDDFKTYLALYRDSAVAAADSAAGGISPLEEDCLTVPTPLGPAPDTGCIDDKKAAASEAAIAAAKYDSKNYDAALKAVKGNFTSTVRSQKMALREMYSLVGPITTVADTAFGDLVDIAFLKSESVAMTGADIDGKTGELYKLNNSVKDAPPDTETVTTKTTELYTTLGFYSALYSVLKDILFVDARVTASVTEGNAPLVVSFSSVGSLDPSGLTIDETKQIQWDLNGDGNWNTSPNTNLYMDCKEVAKATTSCIYKQAGTYRVSLKIKASDTLDPKTASPQKKYSEEIGPGIATITIKVNPPQTKINLSVDNIAQGGPYYMMQYNQNGFLTVNRGSVSVLASKAANEGITFNATLTEAKEGLLSAQTAEGATIKWDFGDASTDPVNNAILPATPDNLKPNHKYEKEGSYTVTAEFTDKNGVIDRKIFTVIVSSIAPLMEINPVDAKIGDEVVFDGSDSASDNGPLTYVWSVSPQLTGLDQAQFTKDTFNYKFTKSGQYTVSLKVDDPITTGSAGPETLAVTSKPPVSQFTFEIPKATQPGTVLLNGSKSYDPDGTEALAYQWEINGQKLPSTADYDFVDSTTPTSAQAKVKFKKAGTYAVTLLATDPTEPDPANAVPVEKEVTVDSVLDIAWGANDIASSVLKAATGGAMQAPVTLTLLSDTAVAYEVDYGDGEKENGDMSKTATLKHNYTKAGSFVVKATVYDAEDNGNSLSRKVYVGSSTQPVAVIGIALNGETVIPEPGASFEISRKDVVSFDASASRNTDNTGRRLNYSWDLGDGEKSTKEKINHTYKDTGKYTVSLKAINTDDVSQTGTDTFEITVKGEPPTLQSLTAVPTGSSLTTPVTVQLNAIGASDPDGKIVKYRWWYYDPANDQDELGVQVSTSSNANLTIGTRGEEGQQKTYKFAVEITDNENNTVSSRDIIDEKSAPELTVTNGPNKAPVAKFNVDRTDIAVGESVNFASASTDADGQIVAYYWDFEGDGFANNTKNEGPNVSHTFYAPAPNGVRVKLKVVDNNESEATSDPVTIYVEGKAQPPKAAFTSAQDGTTKKVKFTNTSTADTASGANIASYAWDFDTATDSDGDSKKDNDTDSTEKDPTHEYKDYGIYRAKLVVTDSEKTKGEVTNFVNVKAPAAPEPVKQTPTPTPTPTPKPTPTPTPTPVSILDARLLTTPAPSFVDGKIHLTGESQDVTLDFSTSVGNIKKYIIDKNVYFDTNGNGIKEDDEDYIATSPGKWTTNFSRSFGNIRVRLTVVDAAGKKDYVEKDIVFDTAAGSVFTANVFGTENIGLAALLVAAAGFAIMTIKRRIASINKQK
jgi:PKD repeat protein